MSDDPRQDDHPASNPPQENFGPAFPEAPAALPSPPSPDPTSHPRETPSPPSNLPPIYGLPSHNPGSPPPTPLPLGEAIRQLPRQYWRIVTKPAAVTFAAELGKASWDIIWMQLIGLGIYAALTSLLSSFIGGLLFQYIFQTMLQGVNYPPGFFTQFMSFYWIFIFALAIFQVVALPAIFFASTSIYYLTGKAFGGQGTFLTYCYGNVLITAPLILIANLLAIIPYLGILIAIAGAVYQIILMIFMTMAARRLSGNKAAASVLIPAITYYVLIVILIIAYIALIFLLERSA